MDLGDPDRELIRRATMVSDSARWEGFTFRDDDIVITTPPKCGTTWTQNICALLVFQTPQLPMPIEDLSPWLDMLTRSKQEIFTLLEQQSHRRFIKTHTPLDGLPFDERVSYICVARDPRDVAMSMLNHRANFDFGALLHARNEAVGLDDVAEVLAAGPPVEPESHDEKFWTWITDSGVEGASSFGALARHISGFWEIRDFPNVLMVHYDDLKSDLSAEMRRIAAFLDIEVNVANWDAMVNASTFEFMKANADRTAPDVSHGLWHSNADFFRNGTSGQWKAVLNDADCQRYVDIARAAFGPDVYDWLHRS